MLNYFIKVYWALFTLLLNACFPLISAVIVSRHNFLIMQNASIYGAKVQIKVCNINELLDWPLQVPKTAAAAGWISS